MDAEKKMAVFDNDRFASLCGIKLMTDENGEVYGEFTVEDKHMNAHGYVNGGMLFTLADIVGGSYVVDGERNIMSLDADFHFLKNVRSGKIYARPYPIRMGRKISVVGVNVESDGGVLMATAIITYYTAS